MHSYAIRWLPTSKQVSNTFGAKWPLAVMPPMGSRMSLLPAGVVLGLKSVERRHGRTSLTTPAFDLGGYLMTDRSVLEALHGVVDKPTNWAGYLRYPSDGYGRTGQPIPLGLKGHTPSRNRQPRPVVRAAEASSRKKQGVLSHRTRRLGKDRQRAAHGRTAEPRLQGRTS